MLGTRLCDTAGNVVWGKRDSLWNFCSLALPFDSSPIHLEHHPGGLVDEIQIVGPFRVHQYDRLLTHLQSLGYEEGGALNVFSYDWRLSNLHTAMLLKQYIDQVAPDPSQQVDIIGHSMGGLVARLYIQELAGAGRVRNLVMMGTPHRGAGQVFRIVEEGWGWWKNAVAGGLTTIRDTLLSFPSVYQLLPSYKNACGWRKADEGPVEAEFSSFDERAWASFNWLPNRFQTAEGKAFVSSALADAQRVATLMQADIPSTIRQANIVTGIIDTRWKSFFHPKTGAFTGEATYAGDGTVMEWSAANGAVSEARGAEEQHDTIFAGSVAMRTITWLLGSDLEPTRGFMTDARGTLRDAVGQPFPLLRLSFEAQPSVLGPGKQGTVVIRFSGDSALAGADLSHIRITLNQQMLLPVSDLSRGNERTISASFTAPMDDGPHLIIIDVPGLTQFQEYLLVLKPSVASAS